MGNSLQGQFAMGAQVGEQASKESWVDGKASKQVGGQSARWQRQPGASHFHIPAAAMLSSGPFRVPTPSS